MQLRDLNFGDVDAKNEILKQQRTGETHFFESYSIPQKIEISDYLTGKKYFVLGLKGTGKTALLRFLNDRVQKSGDMSEMILFKSHVTEEDRQNLSKSSGYEIINTSDVPSFIQDFKEAWKWLIYQKISNLLSDKKHEDQNIEKLCDLTGATGISGKSLGSLFSKISSGSLKFSAEGFGIAVGLGLDASRGKDGNEVSLSEANRTCSLLLNQIENIPNVYIFFDELELFYQTSDQFDRDRRIIRDLVYAISHINAESAENGRNLFLISSLRSEVLHSVLELGHEIGRDVDDYGEKLDWSNQKDSSDHPLLNLVAKKISISSSVKEAEVWSAFFPKKINNQEYYKFILSSSYYRPRDIVRLLRVARDHDKSAAKFTTAHFDQTSTEYSRQTWLEITEELLASYSTVEISALQRFFLGFNTHFFKSDIEDRKNRRYQNDKEIQGLFSRKSTTNILVDLYRIGVIGNDFIAQKPQGGTVRRHRWIFRGNTTLNDAERMAVHKSLRKHLSLID